MIGFFVGAILGFIGGVTLMCVLSVCNDET